jgi:uroporphyrinogen III methyltransferase/synthase
MVPVALVGAGPGAPGLITVRGAEVLRRAEVVVHDHLIGPSLLDLAPATAERVFVGKQAGKMVLSQDQINALLVDRATRGRRVVRLKGGDPWVFGRGAEEAAYLRAHGVAFEIVPGVTAAVGATIFAGIPITHRGDASAVALVTAHDHPPGTIDRAPLDWSALARFPGTLVFYMGVARLDWLCRTLRDEGLAAATPAALIHRGTMPGQRTVVGTLADLPEKVASASVGAPGLIVVGPVVSRRDALAWVEHAPLFGQRIVVTRPEDQASASSSDLEALGAEVLSAPMVEIGPAPDAPALDRAIEEVADGRFDWLVFTSSNGVTHFLDRLLADGSRDLRVLGRVKIAAIGPSTAETLAFYRLRADLVPTIHRSEDLAEAMRAVAAGGRVLLARADRGRDVLPRRLGEVAEVVEVACYTHEDAEAMPPGVSRALAAGEVDWITVTSPAIARRLHALMPDEARPRIGARTRLASLSPLTSATIRELGWVVGAEAPTATWASLVAAIQDRQRQP